MSRESVLKQVVRECNNGVISIVVKVTKRCNIRPACEYCYDFDARCESKAFDMTYETLENLMAKSVGSGKFQRVIFVWHGGEPLIVGRDFYEKAVSLQRKYNRDGRITVENRIQTNSVALDEDWVRFLQDNEFRMETSFDAFDNDLTRGRTSQVLGNILRAKELGYPPANIMFIVTRRNVHRLREAYDYFKAHGLNFTPSPIITLGQACQRKELSITAEEYGEAVADLMDYVMEQKESTIQVRFIDSVLKAVLFNTQNLCSHGYCVYEFISVEHNGDIFPCAKVDDSDWKFGNLAALGTLSDIFAAENYKRYAAASLERVDSCANEDNGQPCEVFQYCRGGCASNAKASGGYSKRDFYCKTYRIVFNRALEIRRSLEEQGALRYLPECQSEVVREMEMN